MNLKERFNLPLKFWIIALIAFVNSVSFTIIIPVLYPYAKEFGLSDFQASLLTTVYALSQFIATPILGKLSDRIGRKPLLVLSFFNGFTFTIFTFAFQPFLLNVLDRGAQTLAILFAMVGILGVLTQLFLLEPITNKFNLIEILSAALLARGILFLLMPTFPDVAVFFILTAVLGVANSFPRPLTTSILSLTSSDQEQGEILGINTSYLSISNALGPATAGLLVNWGYGTPFWVAGALTLLTARFAFTLKKKVNLH